jgi:hypothetical protein
MPSMKQEVVHIHHKRLNSGTEYFLRVLVMIDASKMWILSVGQKTKSRVFKANSVKRGTCFNISSYGRDPGNIFSRLECRRKIPRHVAKITAGKPFGRLYSFKVTGLRLRPATACLSILTSRSRASLRLPMGGSNGIISVCPPDAMMSLSSATSFRVAFRDVNRDAFAKYSAYRMT